MFSGLAAIVANLIVVIAPLLILAVEIPRISRWLVRRRLDPIHHPAAELAVPRPVRTVNTAGLIDPCPTEPIRISAELRQALAARRPEPRVQAPILAGAGGAGMIETRVRPSIREPRS